MNWIWVCDWQTPQQVDSFLWLLEIILVYLSPTLPPHSPPIPEGCPPGSSSFWRLLSSCLVKSEKRHWCAISIGSRRLQVAVKPGLPEQFFKQYLSISSLWETPSMRCSCWIKHFRATFKGGVASWAPFFRANSQIKQSYNPINSFVFAQ